MKKSLFILILASLIMAHSINGQNNTKVLRASTLLGDTISLDEKLKYHLFCFVSNEDFNYAQYLKLENDSIVLRVVSTDSSIQDYQYNYDKILQDGYNINTNYEKPISRLSSNKSVHIESQKTALNRTEYVFVSKYSSNGGLTIKRGRQFHIVTEQDIDQQLSAKQYNVLISKYKEPVCREVTIADIYDGPSPSISITDGTLTQVIHLSEIKYVKPSDLKIKLNVFSGSICSLIGTPLVIKGAVHSVVPFLAIGVPLTSLGVYLIKKGLQSFKIDVNSSIMIINKSN